MTIDMQAKVKLLALSALIMLSSCEPCDCDDDKCEPVPTINTFLECTLNGDSYSTYEVVAVTTTISTDDVLIIAYGPDNGYPKIEFHLDKEEIADALKWDGEMDLSSSLDNSYFEITYTDRGSYTVYSTKDGRGGIFSECILKEYILEDNGLITGTFDVEAEMVDGSGTLEVKAGQFVAIVDIVSESEFTNYAK